MEKKKYYCEICECELEIKTEKVRKSGKGYSEIEYSDEGVYFEDDKVWFCNMDWKMMVDPIFVNLEGVEK